ncbi:hypothetical protein [Pelosinus propionicus]|uniref:Uncharacterized protein n=1 Tax=Pelosinus propionicus DSM 13327 TaxID=1123291 RepID=A0A1I4H118_9FIRM|nr:hypothetical protein [Pelosinus propionicus]SFL36022.1 hypothetical protein SAMN04490355_1002106 [Pelosinus propionicus DSM 13327]
MNKKGGFILILIVLFSINSYAFASYSPKIEGKPSEFQPSNSVGYFLWQDRDGFHLRTSAAGTKHKFSGSIRTNGKFGDIFAKMSGTDDSSDMNNDRDKIDFNLTNLSGEAGIDLYVKGGTDITFELFMDGETVDPENIYIGSEGWHPGKSKFTLQQDGKKENKDNQIIIVDGGFWWGWEPPYSPWRHGPGPRDRRW